MSEESSGEKEFDATQKRLDDARARGEIPKSQDLAAAASYGGFALACFLVGGSGTIAFGNAFASVLGQADRLAPMLMDAIPAPSAAIGLAFTAPTIPLFLTPAVAVLGVLFAQQAFSFSLEKLQFKLSRISPLASAKQKFGFDGMLEFGKNTLKMLAISTLLGAFLLSRATSILGSIYLDTAGAMALLLRLFLEFLLLVFLISASFGALDYLLQRAQHAQKNRMSRKDLMDEAKDAEGDPHVKHSRRERGREIATNRMLADVPSADVVIVNPTHYAVALKWSRAKGAAPICVAKGVDDVAARIREAAQKANVPLHSDPPTARALFATVDLGAEISPEHYRAVAAAIRFAEKMRGLARRKGHAITPDVRT